MQAESTQFDEMEANELSGQEIGMNDGEPIGIDHFDEDGELTEQQIWMSQGFFPIRIVNFINPHCFHFKLDDKILGMEQEIDEWLEMKCSSRLGTNTSLHEPKVGEMVAAYIASWDRWMRAIVDVVLPAGESSDYLVWCLDYG